MAEKKAQSSLEFLYATGFALLVFAISLIIFYQSQSDAASMSSDAEARRICHEVAGQVSAMAGAGGGTESFLKMPPSLGGSNYSVLVAARNRSVAVAYGQSEAGCPLSTSNVSNGSSGDFYITGDSRMRSVNGGVLIG